jgi:predicted transposase YbfD/YdcC
MRSKLGIDGDVIAIDGKTICSTVKSKVCRKLHIMTAMLTTNSVTLAQLATDEKSNEIPKMRELLELVDIEGKIITADAMGCQKETAEQIIKQNGDYFFGLKGNQHQIFTDVEQFFETFKNDKSLFDIAETKEKSRDRFEIRRCFVFKDIEWLEESKKWKSLNTVCAIQRIVKKDGKTSDETLYYIGSIKADAERILQIAREHWQIETMHYFLDVIFNEDECRVQNENEHKSLNAFRKLAIALHKAFKTKSNHKKSIARTMLSCLLNDTKLFDVIAL